MRRPAKARELAAREIMFILHHRPSIRRISARETLSIAMSSVRREGANFGTE